MQDSHLWPLLRQLESGERRWRTSGGRGPGHAGVIHPAQRTGATAGEGSHPLGGAFGHLGCGMNLSIHHREHTSLACLPIAGHLHCLKQVERTIRTQRCGRPHRTHQHHRPHVIDQQLQQPGRFLQCVGAMGDHHPGEIRITGERQTDALHQRAPVLKEQISTVNVGHLLNLNVGDVPQRRHGIQQVIPGQNPGGVGVDADAVSTASGDGSTGGEQQNPVHASRRSNASMKRCIWLVVPMLTRKQPSISGLPAIERIRMPSARRASSTSATGR